jgi:hypothetical protein
VPAPPAAPAKPAETCGGVSFAARGGPPFSPGEELSYDLSFQGLYIGRLELKVGQLRNFGGHRALPLFGRARTSAFASAIKESSGRYMSLVDPESLRPLALRGESTYGGGNARRETVRWNSTATEVSLEFSVEGKDGERKFASHVPMYDVLSLFYFSRTRVFEKGSATCQEIFGDRRMWKLEAKVGGEEPVATRAGDKPTTLVQTVFEALPGPDTDPSRFAKVELDVYFGKDEAQTPLAFVLRTKRATLRGELVSWQLRGRGNDSDWEL